MATRYWIVGGDIATRPSATSSRARRRWPTVCDERKARRRAPPRQATGTCPATTRYTIAADHG